MKKYIAKTTIGISVSLPNGGNTRVFFAPCMNGSSVYYTDDKDIQWALEHHHKFGKMFRLVESDEESPSAQKKQSSKKQSAKSANKKATKSKSVNPNPQQSCDTENEGSADKELEESIESPNENEEDDAPEYKEVTVSDMDAAKDYLAEHFEVVRTKLKNEEIIKETALAFGIVFKFL